jgi:hypothetical protein
MPNKEKRLFVIELWNVPSAEGLVAFDFYSITG